MNVRTAYKTNAAGRGQIVAKAGDRQKTTNYDDALSMAQNHGVAAANLLLAKGSEIMANATVADLVARLDAGQVKHVSNESGTVHRFTF